MKPKMTSIKNLTNEKKKKNHQEAAHRDTDQVAALISPHRHHQEVPTTKVHVVIRVHHRHLTRIDQKNINLPALVDTSRQAPLQANTKSHRQIEKKEKPKMK